MINLSVTQNRTRYDIYAEIISSLRFYQESGISHIGRRANLPLDRTRTIISFMLSRGLINEIIKPKQRPSTIYVATKRGFKYLDLYKQLSRLVTEITDQELELWED